MDSTCPSGMELRQAAPPSTTLPEPGEPDPCCTVVRRAVVDRLEPELPVLVDRLLSDPDEMGGPRQAAVADLTRQLTRSALRFCKEGRIPGRGELRAFRVIGLRFARAGLASDDIESAVDGLAEEIIDAAVRVAQPLIHEHGDIDVDEAVGSVASIVEMLGRKVRREMRAGFEGRGVTRPENYAAQIGLLRRMLHGKGTPADFAELWLGRVVHVDAPHSLVIIAAAGGVDTNDHVAAASELEAVMPHVFVLAESSRPVRHDVVAVEVVGRQRKSELRQLARYIARSRGVSVAITAPGRGVPTLAGAYRAARAALCGPPDDAGPVGVSRCTPRSKAPTPSQGADPPVLITR